MKKDLQIVERRKLLKQEINDVAENTMSAQILKRAGSFIQFVLRQPSQTPWYISAVFLEVLAITPQAIITLISKDPNQLIGNGLFWSAAALLTMPVIPLSYITSRYIFININNHVIAAIQEKQDLDNLRSFIFKVTGTRKTYFRALIISLIWIIIAIPVFSIINNGFIGASYSIAVWMFGFIGIGIGAHYLGWLMRFPIYVKDFHFNLYQLDPSKSEIIFHLSSILSRPFWITAIYLAVVTFVASVFNIFNWVILIIIMIFWVPLFIQFINSQSAINNIVITEKWKTLNELQEQIHKYKNNINSDSSENFDTINNLLDLHEKVFNSSNIKLVVSSTMGFINQLLLPLIAFIISNYESVLAFFR